MEGGQAALVLSACDPPATGLSRVRTRAVNNPRVIVVPLVRGSLVFQALGELVNHASFDEVCAWHVFTELWVSLKLIPPLLRCRDCR
jgi:hypothetical protein